MSTYYENIVFIQGEQANKPLKILDEQGVTELLNYLSQWHYPGEHDTSSEPGNGTTDRVIEINGYLLTINTRFGYVGLKSKIESE